MKKHEPAHLLVLLAVLLGGFLALFSIRPVVAAANEVKIYLAPVAMTVTRGGTFSEQVRISKQGNEKVDYVTAYITFPAQQLEVVSVTSANTAFSRNGGLRSTYNNASGTINITGSSATLGTDVDVYVATINFRAKSDGRASIQFTNDTKVGALLGSGGVKNALDGMVNAAATVVAPPAPQPAPTPAPAPTTPVVVPEQPTPDTAAPIEGAAPIETPTASDTTGAEEQEVTTMSRPEALNSEQTDSSSPIQPLLLWVSVGAAIIAGVIVGALWLARRKKQETVAATVPEYDEGGGVIHGAESASLDVIENARVESAGAQPLFAPAVIEDLPPDFPVETVAEVSESLEETPASSSEGVGAGPVADEQPVVAVATEPKNPLLTASATSQSVVARPLASSAVTPPQVTPLPAGVMHPVHDESTSKEISQPIAETAARDDYKNIPDMFEVGERRLVEEGLSEKLRIPVRPTQAVR